MIHTNYRAGVYLVLVALHLHAQHNLPTILHRNYAVPYADDQRIILATKLLHVPGSAFPFNGTIIRLPATHNYQIVFREQTREHAMISSRIYSAVFDSAFDALTPATVLDGMPNARLEDPRIFMYNGTLHMIVGLYNAPTAVPILVSLDQSSLHARAIHQLPVRTRKEKNWVPFSYREHSKDPEKLYFVYQHNPFEIVTVTNDNILKTVVQHEHSGFIKKNWEDRWGVIRGGTPAIDIGGEYLEFFHSHYTVNRKKLYVFGAITFTKKYPFTITKISAHPILCRRLYSAQSRFAPAAYSGFKVIFPSGFVVERDHERDILHLICGENDAALRLLTIDTKKLLQSLVTVQ